MTCPRCGGTEFHTQQRGYSIMTGFLGSQKVYSTCLHCGYKIKAGSEYKKEINKKITEKTNKAAIVILKIMGIFFALTIIVGLIMQNSI